MVEPRELVTLTWCRVFEAGDADQHLDVVARELRFGDVDLGLDDVLHAEGEVRHGDAFLHPVVHAVDGLVVVAGEVQHGLAHGLRGDGAGVDAGAADHLAHLDQRDLLAQLGAIDGGALACGAGADDDQVVNTTHALRRLSRLAVTPAVRALEDFSRDSAHAPRNYHKWRDGP